MSQEANETASIRLKFLEKDEEDLVHEMSLKNLQENGVLVRSESVLDIMEKAGSIVDRKRSIVRIPETVVREALSKAPKSMTLHARDPKHDLHLPVESVPYIATSGLAVYTLDLETGKRRNSTRKDIANFGKLADALSGIDYFWTTLTATEVPQEAHSVHELWTALQSTTKHVQAVSVINAADARAQIELGACVAGGKDQLRRNPIFSMIICPVAPLSFEKGAVEGHVELSRAGIPVVSMSMSLSGLSCPVTIAGTITNANSENLASLVITQSASPGAPHIYSSESAPIDMTTGGINYYSPDYPLISAALGQMAKRYQLPSMVGSWGAGGELPGMPEQFWEIYGMALSTLTGTDLASGAGSIDSAKGVSAEQLVLDSWLWEDVRPFVKKSRIDKETIALDIVKAVGHSGTFLTNPHTQQNFKKEIWVPDRAREPWQRYPAAKMTSEARDFAKKILKEHEVPRLDKTITNNGERIIQGFEKSLGS